MASRLATRAIALLTPEATPARAASTSRSTVVVTGATTSTRPRAKTVMGGRMPDTNAVPGPAVDSHSSARP